MPVTILDAWTSTADLPAGAHAHAASAGNNRCGLLAFTHEQMGGGGLTISTQVTWGGENVTEITDIVAGDITAYHNLLWLGFLTESQIANMVGSTVVVAFDNDDVNPGDGVGPFDNAKAESAFYQDVDQAALPDPNDDNTTGTGTASAILPADTATINIPLDAKAVVVAVSGQGTAADEITAATGYTARVSVLGPTNGHSIFAFDRDATTADASHNPSFPCASANRLAASIIVLEFEAAAPVLDQDGFQFINDDGSEITATDIAAEDTNINRPRETNTRLRVQVDTTIGDPPAATRTLQYKEVADPADEWRDVPLT